jgi:cell division protein ZapA
MTDKGSKQVVRVTIVGEEYSIRSDSAPEHTRAVAEYVDAAIRRVLSAGGAIETRKAAILAALQITDQLFQAQQASEELTGAMRSLGSEVRRWLPPAKRGDVTIV